MSVFALEYGGGVAEGLYDVDEVFVDVVQLHRGPYSVMPNAVKRFSEVDKDMVELLLVLEVLLAQHSKIKYLLSCAPSSFEPSLLLFDDLFGLGNESSEQKSAATILKSKSSVAYYV